MECEEIVIHETKQVAIKKDIIKKHLGINVKVQQPKLKFDKRVGNKVKKNLPE